MATDHLLRSGTTEVARPTTKVKLERSRFGSENSIREIAMNSNMYKGFVSDVLQN
jgi:hypothetical protein